MKTAVQSTSLNTYRTDVIPSLGHRQKVVYDTLAQERNMTNSELARKLDWPINTLVPRVFELRQFGLVFEDVKRTCNVTGKRVIAWCVTRETLF